MPNCLHEKSQKALVVFIVKFEFDDYVALIMECFFFFFSQSVFFYFILFTLLLACTGNLVPSAVDWGKSLKAMTSSKKKEKIMPYVIALDVALVRKLSLLLVDVRLRSNLMLVIGDTAFGVLNETSVGRVDALSFT